MKIIKMLGVVLTFAFTIAEALIASEFVYEQSTGNLFYTGSLSTALFATGYSGAGEHKNNLDSQFIADLGPIPQGWYTIGEPSTEHGWTADQLFIKLTPDAANKMSVDGGKPRDGFLIHGESKKFPGWASEGCIIIGDKAKRQQILDAARAGSNRLHVIPGPQPPQPPSNAKAKFR